MYSFKKSGRSAYNQGHLKGQGQRIFPLQWVCVIIETLCVNMGSIKVVWFLLI